MNVIYMWLGVLVDEEETRKVVDLMWEFYKFLCVGLARYNDDLWPVATDCQLLESKNKQVRLSWGRCNISSVTSSLGPEHSPSHEWHLHNLIAHSQSSSQR